MEDSRAEEVISYTSMDVDVLMHVYSIDSFNSFSISRTGAVGCKKSCINATHIEWRKVSR